MFEFFKTEVTDHSIFINPLSAVTCPSDLSGRIADHERMIRNVFCYNGTRADEGVTADGVATDDGAVGAERSAALDERGADLIHFADFRSGVVDVGENHGRTAEDAVF